MELFGRIRDVITTPSQRKRVLFAIVIYTLSVLSGLALAALIYMSEYW
jgi:hypothetical protein